MNTGKRTLAFQVSEEFFNEVQDYIKAHKMKLKDFGIEAMRRMMEDAAATDPEATETENVDHADPEADVQTEQE